MKTKFYAVCSKNGVVNMGYDDYHTQKAIFFSKDDAKKAVERNPEKDLTIKEVCISAWRAWDE